MNILDPNFIASQQAARDDGISPVYFAYFSARNRDTGALETMGLWSGDDDIQILVRTPSGGTGSRVYLGGCNLRIEGLQYVLDLTDNPISISMSQIADATQMLIRGYDLRLAHVECHAATLNGGAINGVPDLVWIGIVDDSDIATPAIGGDGAISLTVRSEIMAQLTAPNPAKSSDAHQKRRSAGDRFSEYAGVIQSRKLQWYKQDD